ncbi:MAG TPA: DUF2079 domain-containing protein [Ktedonobacterales bacterium]|nr:DUF2079 domain-containing protein [Ktedonobacterales bacterium]
MSSLTSLRAAARARWNALRLRPVRRTMARLLNRYPPLSPAPEGIWPRVALGIVGVMALAFTIFFSVYLFARHDAYMTHAEDLGIMDQALWNTLHGAPLHQTICDRVTDNNCLGDISRLAIHFEPIMFPLSLLYLIAPSPKTLQFVQALIVASGAFPAFWLAMRRLRSPFAGIVFAAAYLLFPALQAAVTDDFHAVTFSAAFLLFALYFMLSRNNVGLIIACLLALSTKEEIPLDVALIGLSIIVLQRRARLGWGIVALSMVWLVAELAVMHIASPLGQSPTVARYSQFGASPGQAALYVLTHPVQVMRDYVLTPDRIVYLRTLLAPLAYLPLFAPLTLLIAVPALAINMLSGYAPMYSGIYQYNAEIVPVLIVAAIEGIAALAALGAWAGAWVRPRLPAQTLRWPQWVTRIPLRRALMVALTLLVLLFALRAQRDHGYTSLAKGFTWPVVTTHARLADTIIARIPPEASVSAQTDLVPHLSQRRHIYLFPDHMQDADYVFLDVTGSLYPQSLAVRAYMDQAHSLLTGGRYHVVVADDGYLLLAKGRGPTLDPADPWGLPPSFYRFTATTANAIPHATAIRFGPSLRLVGYDASPAPTLYVNNPYLTVTTYWRVEQPLMADDAIELVFIRSDGSEFAEDDFATTLWRPLTTWQPGETFVVRNWPLLVTSREAGALRLGVRVLHTSPGGVTAPVQAVLGNAPGSAPTLLAGDTVGVFSELQVMG